LLDHCHLLGLSNGIFSRNSSAEGRQIEEETVTRSEIRVVTFDLDNTIWKTSSCIDAANRALFDHLATSKVSQPKRVEKIMGEIFAQDKKKYSPLSEGDNPKSPVLLTELRIDAIKHILQLNGFQADHAETFARDAFGIWAKARHDAIPQNLASNVLDCLQKIASMKTSAGHPVLIGAITDGNSDPRNVNCLKDFFHFCVNAESVGVSKPDKVRINFQVALDTL
jgi:FMN phosphatase YigB (HAD superfamily)